MSATDKLAHFVYETNYSNLPENAISKAKQCFLDGLGVMLAGYKHPMTKIIIDFVKELGGRPDATVILSGLKTSLPLAALINGTMGHVMDFDDTNWIVRGHLTTVLLPSILSVGQKVKAGGKEVIAAYILGFEAACKIGRSINPYHYSSGYHSTSTIGVFGATTAAGKLLSLTPKELAFAYGITGSRSAGLRANFGTMTKSLHAGFAAHDGIMAALMGKLGITSNPNILESDCGFAKVMSSEANLEALFQNLGNPFDLLASGVVVKQYPSCAWTHPAVDAVIELIRDNLIKSSDIISIKCGTSEESFNILIYPQPKNGLEAKFSMPYCLARACLDGRLGLDHFEDENVQDPLVLSLMKRVFHYIEPDIVRKGYEFRTASKIRLELINGLVLEKTIDKATGNPEIPLSFDQLDNKFRTCSDGLLGNDNIERVIQFIDTLENCIDINDFIRILVPDEH